MESLEADLHFLAEGKEAKVAVHRLPLTDIYSIHIDTCLDQNWAAGTMFGIFPLEDKVILKMPKQYLPSELDLPSDQLLADFSLNAFFFHGRAHDLFSRLNSTPHPNLVRMLDFNEPNLLFFEHLSPLTERVWAGADPSRRRRWAVELVSAFAHLEQLDVLYYTASIHDLCVDQTGRLKLVGFGASPLKPSLEKIAQYEANARQNPRTDPKKLYHQRMQKAHQRIACCLHFILSGVDLEKDIPYPSSLVELSKFRDQVRGGSYPINAKASEIEEIIQSALTLNSEAKTFGQLAEELKAAFSGLAVESENNLNPLPSEEHYTSLRDFCRDWVKAQVRDARWRELPEYKAACEEAGYLG